MIKNHILCLNSSSKYNNFIGNVNKVDELCISSKLRIALHWSKSIGIKEKGLNKQVSDAIDFLIYNFSQLLSIKELEERLRRAYVRDGAVYGFFRSQIFFLASQSSRKKFCAIIFFSTKTIIFNAQC